MKLSSTHTAAALCSQQCDILRVCGECADTQVIGLVAGRERAGDLCSHGSEISGTGGVGFGFSGNEGGRQVHDYPAWVDGIADVRQGPAEGGTAALEYLLCSLELHIKSIDFTDLLQGPAAELFDDAARSRERVHMTQLAARAAGA